MTISPFLRKQYELIMEQSTKLGYTVELTFNNKCIEVTGIRSSDLGKLKILKPSAVYSKTIYIEYIARTSDNWITTSNNNLARDILNQSISISTSNKSYSNPWGNTYGELKFNISDVLDSTENIMNMTPNMNMDPKSTQNINMRIASVPLYAPFNQNGPQLGVNNNPFSYGKFNVTKLGKTQFRLDYPYVYLDAYTTTNIGYTFKACNYVDAKRYFYRWYNMIGAHATAWVDSMCNAISNGKHPTKAGCTNAP